MKSKNTMKISVSKFLLLILAACALLSCEQNHSDATSKNSRHTKKIESFVRDTSAYAVVVDTSVHDSAFREEIVPVNQGGFTEYFAREANSETKFFYAYSDSVSPFVKYHSERPTFVDLVALAYANHYAMEINPDDIWLMILDGFRLHVKNNRETLKDRFVGPAVDTNIVVSADWLTLESAHEEWYGVIEDLFDSLQEKMPSETGAPLRTKFSTTSPIDYNISRSMVLAVASEYYTYSTMTLCGIPKIKINGTKADWNLLKDSFNKLATRLDMEWWSQQLNPVLDEFINVFDGLNNLTFWKNIYKLYKPEGCRNPEFSGWISKFYPYLSSNRFDDNDFKKRTEWEKNIDFQYLPKVVTSVDIKWDYLGRFIPLKLYTGFVGIQVDTVTNILKASRGYALRSQCTWCNMEKVASTLKFVPGKPYRLQDFIAISDSMNVYDKNGLAFATHDRKEIENFAMSLNYDFEDFDVYLPHRFDDGEKQILSVNLFKDGKLLNHVIYQTLSDFPEIGVMWTFQGRVAFRNKKTVESFFKERNISLEGEVDEFKYEKDLPKLNVEIFVEPFTAIDSLSIKKNNREREELFVKGLEMTCKWRLERAFYRHYKNDFNLSVDAEIIYDDDGRVSNVVMNTEHPVYKDFLNEVKSILYYGYKYPKEMKDGYYKHIIHDLSAVKSLKVHLAFSKDYRMVCKQNGQISKDSVDIIGTHERDAKKDLCSEITFSKDLATGDIIRYMCTEFNKKTKDPCREKVSSKNPATKGLYRAVCDEKRKKKDGDSQDRPFVNQRYDKQYAVYGWLNDSLSNKVSLKIPPCFVEE